MQSAFSPLRATTRRQNRLRENSRGDHSARSHPAEQFANGRVHTKAGQLREIFSPAQGGDSQEGSVQWRDDPDKGSTEGYVRQLGGITPTGEG